MQDSEELFVMDPLPQRPANGMALSDQPILETTVSGEEADRTALEEEEELEQTVRDQYDQVMAYRAVHPLLRYCLIAENVTAAVIAPLLCITW